MDRTASLHPDDRAAYELASLALRAAGIDTTLASMSPELAHFGAAQIITRQGNTPEARMAVLAWLDLWAERVR